MMGSRPEAAVMDQANSASDTGSCLGRTCLKWASDGELTALDMQAVLERLAQVDGDLASTLQPFPDRQPCPSIS